MCQRCCHPGTALLTHPWLLLAQYFYTRLAVGIENDIELLFKNKMWRDFEKHKNHTFIILAATRYILIYAVYNKHFNK